MPYMRISGTWMHICVKMSPRHNFEKEIGGLSKRICRPQFSQKVNHAVGRESSASTCCSSVSRWGNHVQCTSMYGKLLPGLVIMYE